MKVSHFIYLGFAMASFVAMRERATQVSMSLISQAQTHLDCVEKHYVRLTGKIAEFFKSMMKCAKNTIETKTGCQINTKYDEFKKSLEQYVEKGKNIILQKDKSAALKKIEKPAHFTQSSKNISEETEEDKGKKVDIL